MNLETVSGDADSSNKRSDIIKYTYDEAVELAGEYLFFLPRF